MVDRDGIVFYEDPDLGRSVWIRMRRASDQRWEVDELYLPPTDRPVSTDDLRRIPIGRIETTCNDPAMSSQLRAKMTRKPMGLEARARQAGDVARAFRGSRSSEAEPTPRRIDVPRQRPFPPAFFVAVAEAYVAEAPTGRPAARIAEQTKTPVSTVHRWIRECRLRGLLPPARPGKAG